MAQSRLRKLGEYLRPHWRNAALGVLALFIVNLLGMYIPLLIRDGIDQLQVAFTFNQVAYYGVLVLVLASMMWVVRMASRIYLFGVGRQVEFDLKQKIFNHLLSLEPSYFAINTVGDLINRATSDVDNIRRLLGFAVLSLANMIFAYGLTLPVMLAIDWQLSLLSLSVYPLMFVVVVLTSDRLRQEQQIVQEELSSLSELIQEDMSGISLVKIYAQEENERRAFAALNDNLLEANLTLAKTRNILFSLLRGLASVSLLVVLWFGSRAISSGAISVGDFVALLLFVERLVFPTALLGFTITAYQRGEVSIDRIETILTVEPKIQDRADAMPLPRSQVRGALAAKNLTFAYPVFAGAKPVAPALDQVTFHIAPQETVAIVGPIGSGKSTLANALPRLLEIAPNQIFLDGYDITQLRLQDLRRAIAYVPQESFLFSTSIQNNIRYGDPQANDEQVMAAARDAQIHEEVLNFPQQYETLVGERGITLSGGQRQRTALARALLVDAPILILDDALSSVDNETATKILRNLSLGTHRKTVLFISHQLPAAAASSDRILVMDQGQIVQSGTHESLIAQPGLYQDLWEQNRFEEALQ